MHACVQIQHEMHMVGNFVQIAHASPNPQTTGTSNDVVDSIVEQIESGVYDLSKYLTGNWPNPHRRLDELMSESEEHGGWGAEADWFNFFASSPSEYPFPCDNFWDDPSIVPWTGVGLCERWLMVEGLGASGLHEFCELHYCDGATSAGEHKCTYGVFAPCSALCGLCQRTSPPVYTYWTDYDRPNNIPVPATGELALDGDGAGEASIFVNATYPSTFLNYMTVYLREERTCEYQRARITTSLKI
jgi:hypothetical protein